jgi:hypothetical protein
MRAQPPPGQGIPHEQGSWPCQLRLSRGCPRGVPLPQRRRRSPWRRWPALWTAAVPEKVRPTMRPMVEGQLRERSSPNATAGHGAMARGQPSEDLGAQRRAAQRGLGISRPGARYAFFADSRVRKGAFDDQAVLLRRHPRPHPRPHRRGPAGVARKALLGDGFQASAGAVRSTAGTSTTLRRGCRCRGRHPSSR